MIFRLHDDPTRQLEHEELVQQAAQYLEYRGWLVVITHGPRNRPYTKGVTDLIAMKKIDNLLVEIKTEDDELKPDQIKFADNAIRHNLRVYVVKSLEQLTYLVHQHEG